MIKKVGVLIAALFAYLGVQAQQLQITDIELEPIANVDIICSEHGLSAQTNEEGIAVISSFKNESKILLSKQGYFPETYSFKELEELDFKVYLFEKTSNLNPIIIAHNKFAEKGKYIPQEFIQLGKRELSFMNQQTMADVMQNTGHVQIQKSQQGGGSPVIRGFETNKVLMVVDGVRMNNAIYRGGHLQNIITLDNAAMDRVEVLFGPGSVMYGSDALGGVMHFYTKNPLLSGTDKLRVKGNGMVRYNSVNSGKSVHADISIANKNLGSFTSLTYSQFGDLRQGENRSSTYPDFGKRLFFVERINGSDSAVANDNVNLQLGSGYSQYDLLQKFLFRPNKDIRHILNLQMSTSSDVPRYDRLSQLEGTVPKFSEWYYGPQKRFFSSYSMELSKANSFYSNARMVLAYQKIEESRNTRRFNNDTLNKRVESLDILTVNFDFSKKQDKHELHYGIDGWTNIVNSEAELTNIVTNISGPLDTRYPDGGSDMSSVAGYVSHTFKINEKWVLNDGLRLSYVNLQSKFIDTSFFPFPLDEVVQKNQALNGNLGIIFNPSKDWKINLLASSGFRAPNVDDLSKVFDSSPGNVVVPNPDLKSEFTYNLDFGVTRRFKDKIVVNATTYYTWYRNAITTGVSTFNGQHSILYEGQLSQVVTSLNAQQAYIYVANVTITADLSPRWSVKHSTNYTYGRIVTGSIQTPLDHIAPIFGKTSVSYRYKKIKGELYALYNGEKRSEDYKLNAEDNEAFSVDPINGYTPAWATLNIRAGYHINKNLQVLAAVENIADKNYRPFASNISGAGRNFSLSIRGFF